MPRQKAYKPIGEPSLEQVNRKILAYGSEKSLEGKGRFRRELSVNDRREKFTMFLIYGYVQPNDEERNRKHNKLVREDGQIEKHPGEFTH